MPKVTVLMSVFNGGKFLEESVQSILSQTLIDFEFLIFDDGSFDGSEKKLDQLSAGDTRVKVVRQKNIGLTKTLNLGLRLARGEYVARMDSDDVAMPDRLQKQVSFLDNNPEIALVASFAKIIDEKGQEIGEHWPAVEHDAIRKLSFFSGQICHPSVMFRKNKILDIGGYDENFQYAQDCDLWFRLMKENRVANIPEFLLKWRKTSEGIGTRKQAEQQVFARRAKRRALKGGLYPWYYVFFLIWPHIRFAVPIKWRKWIKAAC